MNTKIIPLMSATSTTPTSTPALSRSARCVKFEDEPHADKNDKKDKIDKKDKKDKNIDAINAIYAVFHGAVVASITAIYEKHNPTKLSDMERLFRKYAGREQQLYEACALKYEGQDHGFAGGSSVGMK